MLRRRGETPMRQTGSVLLALPQPFFLPLLGAQTLFKGRCTKRKRSTPRTDHFAPDCRLFFLLVLLLVGKHNFPSAPLFLSFSFSHFPDRAGPLFCLVSTSPRVRLPQAFFAPSLPFAPPPSLKGSKETAPGRALRFLSSERVTDIPDSRTPIL